LQRGKKPVDLPVSAHSGTAASERSGRLAEERTYKLYEGPVGTTETWGQCYDHFFSDLDQFSEKMCFSGKSMR
jgi:hypothetical protein